MKIPLAQCSLALLSKFGVATHVGQTGSWDIAKSPFCRILSHVWQTNYLKAMFKTYVKILKLFYKCSYKYGDLSKFYKNKFKFL